MKRLLITILLMSGIWSSSYATTRYVSKTGSGTTGLSWANAYTTIAQVNSGTASGDTVVFGTGIWRGTTLVPVSGSSGDRTCYIDSGFFYATRTSYPTRRVAWLYGSNSLSGWTMYSGNVYQASASLSGSWCLFQGETWFPAQTSIANVNGPGKWYSNGSTVYAWAVGGGDPDNYDMEIPRLSPLVNLMNGTVGISYVSFVGMGFKYANNRLFTNSTDFYNTVTSIHWDHCYLSCAAGDAYENESLVMTNQPGGGDGSTPSTDFQMVACSLGSVIYFNPSPPQTENATQGNCVTLYDADAPIVESCFVFGHQSEAGLYIKCGPSALTWAVRKAKFRFNTIHPDQTNPYGIRIYGSTNTDSIYGNVIWGCDAGVHISYWYATFQGNPKSGEGYHFIGNNTFISCNNAVRQYDYEGKYCTDGVATNFHKHNKFLFNVVYNTSSSSPIDLDSISQWDKIDSNMYFTTSGSGAWKNLDQRSGGFCTNQSTSYTFSGWGALTGGTSPNTYLIDQHSTNTTNPNFTSAATGDFSRPAASGEMSRTYGGRPWTKYGAIQGAGAIDTSIVISGGSVVEGSTVTFVVSINRILAANLTINYQTNNGTATAGTDYLGSSGTKTITAGTLSVPITVTTYNIPGYQAPGSKAFTVTIFGQNMGTIGTAFATGTITDADAYVPPSTVTTSTSLGGTVNISGSVIIK